ncbi:SRPBCC family protein [Aquimarina gracilis]|uniref:SRPBCC family protein n=1 Tax=Aquimarina gracilis TaxID=874422 RepID=A0ABU5ZUM1_9FLAO|nr:SRPBCC family protein [Aquimarina gracilis]MEB3345082.1 SRPBCC family protein [Aquimarina gracilis]
MKYTVETIIEKPLDQVIELYNNPTYYRDWMPGIISHTITSGNKREQGTKSVFKFQMNGKNFNIEETIIKNRNTEIVSQFVANGTVNIQCTLFSETSNGNTLYQVNESFQLKGFMKIIGFLMPGSFKKQTEQFVQAFKQYAENQ